MQFPGGSKYIFPKSLKRPYRDLYIRVISKTKHLFICLNPFDPIMLHATSFTQKNVSPSKLRRTKVLKNISRRSTLSEKTWKPVGCGTVKQLNMFKWSLKHPKLCKVVLFANCKPLCLRNQWLKKTSMITKSNSQREH